MNKRGMLVLAKFGRDFYDCLGEDGFTIYREMPDQSEEINFLVVRSSIQVNAELVDRLPNLQCVITATHGKDHVDEECLRERSIDFYTTPVQSEDVAQGVIGYILAHATRLIEGDRSMKQSQWNKRTLIGLRIRGKTLGIIGYGRIGRCVEQMAQALGMNVVLYDPYVKKNTMSLTSLLAASDFVTIHVPLTEETRCMIGEKEISKMKDGVYLINTARGGIVDESALLDAIEKGKLSGAALDVYLHQYPFKRDISKQLVEHPNVIATPHSIGQTREALRDKGEAVIKIIKKYVSSKRR